MESCRSYEDGGGILSTRPYSSNARRKTSLIETQSRVLSLEGEVSHLQHQLSAERLRRGTTFLTTSTLETSLEDNQVKERCHKLEQERCCLAEQLACVKSKLAEADQLKDEAETKYTQLQDQFTAETRTLQDQLEDLTKQNCALDIANGGLQMELHAEELLQPSHQLQQIAQLKDSYSKSVKGLKDRLSGLEQVDSQLLCSQIEVKHLQHLLRTYRQETQFVGQMRGQLVQLGSSERQVSLLKEEIAGLHQSRANADLLRYQVQELKKKCEELQVLEEEVLYLRLENSKLQTGHGGSKNMDTCDGVLLQLAELQQREAVSVSQCGHLQTQLEVSEQALARCEVDLQRAQEALLKEQASAAVLEDRVQKLERRLLFVSKERDGCVNVLNSYKLDSGVDSLTKEWLTELRHQLDEKTKRIADLETELEEKS